MPDRYLKADERKEFTQFYADDDNDSSDIEKVVMCSVISSGRFEGEESLSNT